MAPLSSENKDLVLAVHSILVPDTWHPERDTGRVKVEVDNHGPTLEGSGNVQSMELEEDAGHHHHQDPLDTKPASQDSSKPNKVEPYRCRYDSSCSVVFRSVKVILLSVNTAYQYTFHEVIDRISSAHLISRINIWMNM